MEVETPDAALQFLDENVDLEGLNSEDKRNSLIVKLNSVTSHSIPELQGMSTTGTLGSLVGLASISGSLLKRNIKTSSELISMSYEDQRNALIDNFNQLTGRSHVSYIIHLINIFRGFLLTYLIILSLLTRMQFHDPYLQGPQFRIYKLRETLISLLSDALRTAFMSPALSPALSPYSYRK